MKTRGFIGLTFIVASLLKLATMWGIIHLGWFERATEDITAVYFAIFILIFVGVTLIYNDLTKDRIRNKFLFLKAKGIIGVLLVLPCLLKLATMWGIIHLNWFDGMSIGIWETYVVIFVMICVGFHLIFEGFRNNDDQWLQRPLPIDENGKRIYCSASFGGDMYVYQGEAFHGACLKTKFGGIRLDLRKALIMEDEVIDISNVFGGVELFVPAHVNIEVKSRSFIGGVGNETLNSTDPKDPCLHIVASNVFGGVAIKNEE